MRTMKKLAYPLFALALLSCQGPTTAKRVDKLPKKLSLEPKKKVQPSTADFVLTEVRDGLRTDCTMPKVPEDLASYKVVEEAYVDSLLTEIKDYAASCGGHELMEERFLESEPGSCSQQQSCDDACPIKWYWCVEHAGACAGGDDVSCCKLGMCGGKHHCKTVCRSSCNCDISPVGPSTASG